MKKIFCFLLLYCSALAIPSQAQEFTLKKGIITDSLIVGKDESFAIYLPSNFELGKKWPMVLVFDMQGRGRRVISMFKSAAESQGYVLVGSNSILDSISIAKNMLATGRLLKKVTELVPADKGRIYSAGFSAGAKFAALAPSFIRDFKGVISIGSAIPNYELLTSKNTFHFMGIVGDEDFNYKDMVTARPTLKKLKFPNQLWTFDGGHEWPEQIYIERALITATLLAMSKGSLSKNESFISETYEEELNRYKLSLDNNDFLTAYERLNEIIGVYQLHRPVDSLLDQRKLLRKNKSYKTERRNENAALFKESLIRDEYQYNLLEDITTLNYNNLGWWNYQVGDLKKYEQKTTRAEQKMGLRLLAYLNALIEDNIDIEEASEPINDEALSFLWMLKTITEPDNFDYYLKIISDSAKYEDFGTCLFYLEELLKRGYKDKSRLYTLENTALLRITPEFNELIAKYLKDARYEIIEE